MKKVLQAGSLTILLIYTVFIAGWLPGFKWEAVTAMSSAVLAVFTVLIVFFAKEQLKASGRRETADFALRFKRDFFTDKTRDLVMLCDNDLLEFIEKGDDACFKVLKEKQRIDQPCDVINFLSAKERDYYSTYEIDDFLLTHLEDLGTFETKKVLDIDYIYEGFSWYLVTAFENEAVKQYIKWVRKSDGADIYNNFERIYHKMKEEEQKRGGLPLAPKPT